MSNVWATPDTCPFIETAREPAHLFESAHPAPPDACLGDSAPAWSPDGNRLVFERAFGPIVKDTAAGVDLVTVNADGSGEQVILHYRSLEAQGQEPHDAQWSPDGTRIAVMILNAKAKPHNGSAIYVVDADGSHLRQVTPIRLNAGNPDWSPDGKRIAFNSSFEGQAAVEIYTVRPDGSGLRRLRREPKDSRYSGCALADRHHAAAA